MRTPFARTLLVATAALGPFASACETPPDFTPYDNDAVLSAALASNAKITNVGPDESSPQSVTSSQALQGAVKLVPLDDGGFAAVIAPSRESVIWSDSNRTLGLVRGGPSGIQARPIAGARSLLVSVGDEALIVTCDGNGGQVGWLSDAAQGLVQLSGDTPSCQPDVSGRAAGPREAIFFQGTLRRWRVDAATHTSAIEEIDPQPAVLPPVQSVVFLDERAPGSFAFVTLEQGTLTYLAGGAPVVANGIEGLDGSVTVRRGADGALRVATGAGLWRWDATQGMAAAKLADVPAPLEGVSWTASPLFGGAYAWKAAPNPLNPAELLPTAASVRYATDDAFVTFDPSPTPCCDADACRHAAESYVIGGYGEASSRVAFYDLWTWVGKNEHVMVVAGAPLACGP
jgi:hypothetical protein